VAWSLLVWAGVTQAAYDLDFTVPVGPIKLAVSMAIQDLPGRGVRLPAVLIVPGAQLWDRNGDLRSGTPYGHYRDISNALVAMGFAVFRYDKRGLGESTGTASFDRETLAADARAVLYAALKRSEIDPKRYILVGHSQGTDVICRMRMDDFGIKPLGVALLSPVAQPEEVAMLFKCPLFLAAGERDRSEVVANMKRIAEAARGAGATVRTFLVPGGSHLLFDVSQGTPDYSSPETSVSRPLLIELSNWAKGLIAK
jgi:alpha-beta hydrolase superfamily lysophospholipase